MILRVLTPFFIDKADSCTPLARFTLRNVSADIIGVGTSSDVKPASDEKIKSWNVAAPAKKKL